MIFSKSPNTFVWGNLSHYASQHQIIMTSIKVCKFIMIFPQPFVTTMGTISHHKRTAFWWHLLTLNIFCPHNGQHKVSRVQNSTRPCDLKKKKTRQFCVPQRRERFGIIWEWVNDDSILFWGDVPFQQVNLFVTGRVWKGPNPTCWPAHSRPQ